MKSICVYCGSNAGLRPTYAERAKALGTRIANENLALVYGGGNVGLMGIVADAVLEGGGEVIGVIPQQLVDWVVAHRGVTKLEIVGSMHESKESRFDLSRTEERSVGKECVRTCRSWWLAAHKKNKDNR